MRASLPSPLPTSGPRPGGGGCTAGLAIPEPPIHQQDGGDQPQKNAVEHVGEQRQSQKQPGQQGIVCAPAVQQAHEVEREERHPLGGDDHRVAEGQIDRAARREGVDQAGQNGGG